MKRTTFILLLVAGVLVAGLLVPNAHASPLVPTGLSPGDEYHLVFASNLTTAIGVSGVFPPFFPLMGSLMDADYYVTQGASTAGLISGWDGVSTIYTAILSTSTENAKDRFTVGGPIYNTNDQLIANDFNDLWDGTIQNPILYNEFGIEITFSPEVWTGTNAFGNWQGNSCGNWDNASSSAAVGLVDATTPVWIFGNAVLCSGSGRLYGISPLLTVPIPEPSTLWLAGIGIVVLALSRRCRP